MKGYPSLSGGKVYLLFELTPRSTASKPADKTLPPPEPPPPPPPSAPVLPHLPLTHLPLCASLRVNILFSPSLFHTLRFTYSSIVGFYIREGPIYPEELPRFSGIWTVPPRTDLSAGFPP